MMNSRRRLTRLGIATLASLSLVLSPVSPVGPSFAADEATAQDTAATPATMGFVKESPVLGSIQFGVTTVRPLNDSHLLVFSEASYSDAAYEILDSDLQPVASTAGELGDLNNDVYTFLGDDLYYITKKTNDQPSQLVKRTASKSGLGEKTVVISDLTNTYVKSLAASVDGQSIGAVAFMGDTDADRTDETKAYFLTWDLNGQETSKVKLPNPDQLYPEADGTRSSVYSSSISRPLRGLADGTWMLYTKANVTKADESSIPNPPIHITPAADTKAALFTGGDDIEDINNKKSLNGFTVSPDGMHMAVWDVAANTDSGRMPRMYAYTVSGGALTKLFGGDYPEDGMIQGVGFKGDDTYEYSATPRELNKITNSNGEIAESLDFGDKALESPNSEYGNAVTIDGDMAYVAIPAKNGSWKSFTKIVKVELNKTTTTDADMYEFRYKGDNGGNVTPGSETDGSATKHPVFEDKATMQDLPEQPATVDHYTLGDAGKRDDVTFNTDTGVLTFAPKTSAGLIEENKDSALVSFPVTVHYKDGSEALADVTFTVFRPDSEKDRGNKKDNEIWAVFYNESLNKDARVGVPVTVEPTADDILTQGYKSVPLPEGTVISTYPESDTEHRLPEGMVFDKTNYSITYTAPPSEAGKTVSANVLATFEDGTSRDVTVGFKVGKAPTKSLVVASFGSHTDKVGKEIKISPSLLDANLNPMTDGLNDAYYEFKGTAPEGMSINHSTGEITFTPKAAGNYDGEVVVYFKDANGEPQFAESGYAITATGKSGPQDKNPPQDETTPDNTPKNSSTPNSSTPNSSTPNSSKSPEPSKPKDGGSSKKDDSGPGPLAVILPIIGVLGLLGALGSVFFGIVKIPGLQLPGMPVAPPMKVS